MEFDPFSPTPETQEEGFDPFAGVSAPSTESAPFDPFTGAAPVAPATTPEAESPSALPEATSPAETSQDRWSEITDPKIRKIVDEDYEAKKSSSFLPASGPSNLLGSAISGAIGAVTGVFGEEGGVEGAKKAWESAQKEYPVEEVYDPKTGKINLTKLGRSKFDQHIRNTLSIEDLYNQTGIPAEYLQKFMKERGVVGTDASAAEKIAYGAIQTTFNVLGNLQPWAMQKLAGTSKNLTIPGDYLSEAEEPYRKAAELAKFTNKPTRIKSANGIGEIDVVPGDTVHTLERKSFDLELEWAQDVLKEATQSGLVQWGALIGGTSKVASPVASLVGTKAFQKVVPRVAGFVTRNPRLANIAAQAIEGGLLNEPIGNTVGEDLKNRASMAIAGGVLGTLGKIENEPRIGAAPVTPRVEGEAPITEAAAPHIDAPAGAMDPKALAEAKFQLRDDSSPVARAVDLHTVESTGGLYTPEGLRNIKVLSDLHNEASSRDRSVTIPEEHVTALLNPKEATGNSARFAETVNAFRDVVNDTENLILSMEERGMGNAVTRFLEGVGKNPVHNMREVVFQNMMRGVNAGQDTLERLGLADPRAVSTVNLAEKLSEVSKESFTKARKRISDEITNNKSIATNRLNKLGTLLEATKSPSAVRVLRLLDSALRSTSSPDLPAIQKHLSRMADTVPAERMSPIRKEIASFTKNIRKAENALGILPALETSRNISDPTAAVALGSRARTRSEAVIEQVSKGGKQAANDHLLPILSPLMGERQNRMISLYSQAVNSVTNGKAVNADVLRELSSHVDEVKIISTQLAEAHSSLKEGMLTGNEDLIRQGIETLHGMASEIPEGAKLAEVLTDPNAGPKAIASAVAETRRNLGQGTVQLQSNFLDGLRRYNAATYSVEGLTARVAEMKLGDVAGIITQLNNASRTFMLSSHLEKLQQLQLEVKSKYMESLKGLDTGDLDKVKMFEVISGDVLTRLRLSADPELLLKSPDHITNMVEMNNYIAKDLVENLSDVLSRRIGRPISKEFILGYFLRKETVDVDLRMLVELGLSGASLDEQVRFWDRRRGTEGSWYEAANTETVERLMSQQTLQTPLESFSSAEADFRKHTKAVSDFINKHFTSDIVNNIKGIWSEADVIKGATLWDGAGEHLDFYDKFVPNPEKPGTGTYHLEPLGIVHKEMFYDTSLGRELAGSQRGFVEEAKNRFRRAFAITGDSAKAMDDKIIERYAQHLYAKWAGMANVPRSVWEAVYEQRQFQKRVDLAVHAELGNILKSQNEIYSSKLGILLPERKYREHYVHNSRKYNPDDKLDLAHSIYSELGMSGLWKSSDEAQLEKAAQFDGVTHTPATPMESLLRSINSTIRDGYVGHTRAYLENYGFLLGREGWDAEHAFLNVFTRGGDINPGEGIVAETLRKVSEAPVVGTAVTAVKGIADSALPTRIISLRLSSLDALYRNMIQQYNTAFPMIWEHKKFRNDRGVGRYLGDPVIFTLNRIYGPTTYFVEGAKFLLDTHLNLFRQANIPPGMRGIIAEESNAFSELSGRLRRDAIQKAATEVEKTGAISRFGNKLSGITDWWVDLVGKNLKERAEVGMVKTSMQYGANIYSETTEILKSKGAQAAYDHLLPLLPFRNQQDVWTIVRSMENGIREGVPERDFRSFLRIYGADSITRFGKMSIPQVVHRVSKVSPGTTLFIAAKTNMGYRMAVYPTVRWAQMLREAKLTPEGFSNGTNGAVYTAWATQMATSVGYKVLMYGGAASIFGGVIASLRDTENDEHNSIFLRLIAGATGKALDKGIGVTTGMDFTKLDPNFLPTSWADLAQGGSTKSGMNNMIVGWDNVVKALQRVNEVAGEFGWQPVGQSKVEVIEAEIATLLNDPTLQTPDRIAANQKRLLELDEAKTIIQESNDKMKWAHLADTLLASNNFTGWIQRTMLEPVTFGMLLAMGQLDDMVNNVAVKKSPIGSLPKYQDRPLQSIAQAFGLNGVPGEVGFTPNFAQIGKELADEFGVNAEEWAMNASKAYAAMLHADDIYNALAKEKIVAPVSKKQSEAATSP